MKKVTLQLTVLLLALLCARPLLAADGQLSTHILDINKGMPAQGVYVELYRYDSEKETWNRIKREATGQDGRVGALLPAGGGNEGIYKIRFETADYFEKSNTPSIYPYIEVTFKIEGSGHYHIPLTLSANGFSTYRGS